MSSKNLSAIPSFLRHDGEMSALLASHPWDHHPLGAPASWPQSLKTVVNVCVHARFPMLLWWGPELYMLYNDAYRRILGSEKHPRALGRAGAECCPEVWHTIGPMLHSVLASGTGTRGADQLLTLDRNGFLQECYFTFSFSPIHDETGGVGGVFAAVTETTARVLHERRLETLRRLNDAISECGNEDEVLAAAVETLARQRRDFVWAACWSAGDGPARCMAASEDVDQSVEIGAGIGRALRTGEQQQVFLPWAFGPRGRQLVLVQPIPARSGAGPARCLVLAQNPWRTQDELFLRHAAMAAGCVGAALERVAAPPLARS